MIRLSEHFTLEELIASQTAARRRIDNTPSAAIVEALRETAQAMEAVRSLLGDRPITISSGYRSAALNRAIGGARNSAHVRGRAVDFNCFGFGAPIDVCRAIAGSGVPFDQMIEEGTWVHVSFDPKLRRQILTKAPGWGYRPGLRDD
jgi:hypothetical protein